MTLKKVSSQAQNEINPMFDASREEQLYANFNYDCSNLAWPKGVKGTYRVFIENEGERLAYTFYIFDEDKSLLDLERQHNEGEGSEADPFRLEKNERLLPPPIYVSEEVASQYGLLSEYEGKIVCWGGYQGRRCSEPGNYFKVCVGSGIQDAYKCDDELGVLNRVGLEESDSCGPGDIGKILNNDAGVPEIVAATPDIPEANFIPPTLQQLENYFLDIVYIIWAFVGTFAAFQLLYIGFQIMTSGFSPERLGKEYSKLSYWVVGLVGFFLAIPALHFIYESLNMQHTKCFYYEDSEQGYDLTLPGFTFFFKDVCTGEFAVESSE